MPVNIVPSWYYRYDLYDLKINPKEYYQTIGEIIADPRYSFVTIEVDEVLFEGGRSIRYLLHPLLRLITVERGYM